MLLALIWDRRFPEGYREPKKLTKFWSNPTQLKFSAHTHIFTTAILAWLPKKLR